MEAFVQTLKDKLQTSLPGVDAQYRMAPRHRERIDAALLKEGDYRPSAVMILFCEDAEGRLFIPLTERMSYEGVHSGQISLPGGKFEQGDNNLMQTALRECYEEIGLKDLEVIGKLSEIYISVSKFLVHPYVAVCKQKNPIMTFQQREVKSLVKLPLDALLDDGTVEVGSIELTQSLKITTPWFNVNGHRVWGATAMILNELKELILTTS